MVPMPNKRSSRVSKRKDRCPGGPKSQSGSMWNLNAINGNCVNRRLNQLWACCRYAGWLCAANAGGYRKENIF